MDIVKPILKIVDKLCDMCGQVKSNKERCQRLAVRVRAMEEIVRSVKEPEVVRQGLEELKCTLEAAEEVVKKSDNALNRIVRVHDQGEFERLSDRLNHAFQLLSLALQIDQQEKMANVFSEARRREEDRVDKTRDHKELEKLAEKMDVMKEGVDSVKDEVDSVRNDMRDIKNILEQRSREGANVTTGAGAVRPTATGKSGGSTTSCRSNVTEGQHFVDKNQMELIKRITSVSPILDHLLVKKIISGEMYGQIVSERTPANQMRKLLYDVILTHGVRAKDELVAILETEQPYLMDTLRGK